MSGTIGIRESLQIAYAVAIDAWKTAEDTAKGIEALLRNLDGTSMSGTATTPTAWGVAETRETGGRSMNQEITKSGSGAEDLCRVRRIRDGWYLAAHLRSQRAFLLAWYGPVTVGSNAVMEWPRAQAEHIAAAMIALTGDAGVEIEPAEG